MLPFIKFISTFRANDTNIFRQEVEMGRDGLVFVNVRKDIVKLKRKDNLAEAPFKEHGAGTSTRWSHW